MIADRVRQTSGGVIWTANPTLKINFENGWIDEVLNTAWSVTDANTTYIDIRQYQPKFGANCMMALNKGRYMYMPYSSSFAILTKDFTCAFWIKYWQSSAFKSGSMLAGLNSSAVLETVSNYGGLVMRVITDIPSTIVYSTPTQPWPADNTWAYIKFGRKGNKIFLNVNSSQVSTTIPDNLNIRDVGSEFNFGNHYSDSSELQTHFDSFIFVVGVGDDSLEVPTTPF